MASYDKDLTDTVRFRVTAREMDAIRRKVKRRRVTDPSFSVSAYMRSLLARDLGVEPGGGQVPAPEPTPPPKPTRDALADEMEYLIEHGERPPEVTEDETESWFLPHILLADGAGHCIGGCDPDIDQCCTVGPQDERRVGRRRR